MRAINISRTSRARPCRFRLPDASEIVVKPPTLDQAIQCLLLDPEPGGTESPLDQLRRVREQARVLLGPEHADLTTKLDQWQLGEIIGALYISASGMNAEAYARWQLGERQKQRSVAALEIIARMEDMCADLAAELERLPSEVGAQPLADLIALRERLEKRRKAEIKFQAALHHKTFR